MVIGKKTKVVFVELELGRILAPDLNEKSSSNSSCFSERVLYLMDKIEELKKDRGEAGFVRRGLIGSMGKAMAKGEPFPFD
jgi:hypothetical protein